MDVLRIRDDVRQARDAESAHLEAALKIDGAKSLRLAQLRDVLRERGFAGQDDFDFKLTPGAEPQLWLDLGHFVVMKPDAGTYCLTAHGPHNIETVLETTSLNDVVAACVRVMAHHKVQLARRIIAETSRHEVAPTARRTTLVYVWLTGVITGIAALALYAIVMKKLPF